MKKFAFLFSIFVLTSAQLASAGVTRLHIPELRGLYDSAKEVVSTSQLNGKYKLHAVSDYFKSSPYVPKSLEFIHETALEFSRSIVKQSGINDCPKKFEAPSVSFRCSANHPGRSYQKNARLRVFTQYASTVIIRCKAVDASATRLICLSSANETASDAIEYMDTSNEEDLLGLSQDFSEYFILEKSN